MGALFSNWLTYHDMPRKGVGVCAMRTLLMEEGIGRVARVLRMQPGPGVVQGRQSSMEQSDLEVDWPAVEVAPQDEACVVLQASNKFSKVRLGSLVGERHSLLAGCPTSNHCHCGTRQSTWQWYQC